jgi:hypothetical protein
MAAKAKAQEIIDNNAVGEFNQIVVAVARQVPTYLRCELV